MTTSLSSSLGILSLPSSTRWASDSASDEDEIVWSLSSSESLSSSSPINSPLSETADFVLVPRIVDTNTSTLATRAAASGQALAAETATAALPPQPAPTPDGIAEQMATLSLSSASASSPASAPARPPAKKKGRKSKKKAAGPLSAAAEPGAPTPPAPAAPRGIPKRKKATAHSSSSSSSPSFSGGLSTVGVAHPRPSSPPKSNVIARKQHHDGHILSTSSRTSSSAVSAPSKSERRAKKKGTAAATAAAAAREQSIGLGLGLRAVVDDSLSEASGEERSATAAADAATVGYHEAQKFMTSYLAHPPPPGNNGSALLMLQALILELGCLPNNVAAGKFSIPKLPGSLRQAKLILKSRAFINVRDYLAVREQGQAALRRVMHPSRNSLVQEVRKGKRVSVHEVKKAGLNVLLVNTRF